MTKTQEAQLRKAKDTIRVIQLMAELGKRRELILIRKTVRAFKAGALTKTELAMAPSKASLLTFPQLEAEDQEWARAWIGEMVKLELDGILPPAQRHALTESMRKVVPEAFRIVGMDR